MVKTRRMAGNLLLMIIAFLFLKGAVAAQDFSADLITTTKEGVFKGRVFCANDKMRMEIPQAVTIARVDLNKSWMLMREQKMYVELPVQPQNLIAGIEKIPGEIERKLIAKEAVDGVQADKYEVLYTLDNKEDAVFIWVTPDSNYPVKSQAKDGSWTMEYKNVVMAPQPEALFELPAEYKKLATELSTVTSE